MFWAEFFNVYMFHGMVYDDSLELMSFSWFWFWPLINDLILLLFPAFFNLWKSWQKSDNISGLKIYYNPMGKAFRYRINQSVRRDVDSPFTTLGLLSEDHFVNFSCRIISLFFLVAVLLIWLFSLSLFLSLFLLFLLPSLFLSHFYLSASVSPFFLSFSSVFPLSFLSFFFLSLSLYLWLSIIYI